MDQEYKNLGSIKPVKYDFQELDSTPEQENNNIKKWCYVRNILCKGIV